MSVRILSRVWDGSTHGGTALLMLLAIADFADDDGNAYPGVPALARKCRMSARNANFILAELKASGELEVRQNEGPKGTNRYHIALRSDGGPLKQASAPKPSRPLKPTSAPTPEAGFTPEADFTLKPTSSTPEAGFPIPLKPTSDEPSLNRQEPSRESARTRRTTNTATTPLPQPFAISAAVTAWAKSKGFSDLDLHLEHFSTKARAKGYFYADWDAAFMGAVRDDWAGLRKAANGRSPLHADDVFEDAR